MKDSSRPHFEEYILGTCGINNMMPSRNNYKTLIQKSGTPVPCTGLSTLAKTPFENK